MLKVYFVFYGKFLGKRLKIILNTGDRGEAENLVKKIFPQILHPLLCSEADPGAKLQEKMVGLNQANQVVMWR